MLSLFPQFLSYDLYGSFLVRVTVALVLLYIGIMTNSVKKPSYEVKMRVRDYSFPRFIPIIFGTAEIITGVFLLVGFLTQLMVLIAIYIFINLFFIEKYAARVFDFKNIFYVAMVVISLSLLFLGPGAFAVDLPL